MPKHLTAILTVLLTLSLSACVYRPTIQQGNIIPNAALKQLRPGLSKQTVEDILGSPVLVNTFSNSTLVYVYTIKPGYGRTKQKLLKVYFRGNRMTHYSKNY